MADLCYIEEAQRKLELAAGSLLVAMETLELDGGDPSLALAELRHVESDLFRAMCNLRFAKDLAEFEARREPSNVIPIGRLGPGGGRK